MTATSHTIATLVDVLNAVTRRTEQWQMPFGDDDIGGTLNVLRLITEGSDDDHDELVVTADADSHNAHWEYFWSSDPDYPFVITDTTNQRVFENLPGEICDVIEAVTGLDMTQARPGA